MTPEEKLQRKMLSEVPWSDDWGMEVKSAVYYMVRILASSSQAEISRFEQIYRVPIYVLWQRVKDGDVEELKGKWYAHNRTQSRRGDV